ncbi:MAG: exo-alpha-sialidase [Deltaproteobacteria bacterium]|nr:exo-alpha-sialidase [Deltaproteobacteria bacterium]
MVGLLVGLSALVCSATDGGVLFSDTFSRTSTDSAALGAQWSTQGLWYSQNEAISDLDGTDIAVEKVATCSDGQVSASVIGFGVPHTAIFMRSTPTGSARYQLDLISNAHVQIQRVSGSSTTVLADVASGLSDLTVPATLSLSVTGTSPVQLVALLNGRQVASVTDTSASAITASGYAGLFTRNAGVVFDSFVLIGASASSVAPDAGVSGVDAGPPDAGTVVVDAGFIVDAGPRDAGAVVVDAGSIVDAGPRDAGSVIVDAGSIVDAGPRDAGAPDAGSSGILFTDAFSRTSTDSTGLGSQWNSQGLWYSQNEAISDLDGTDIAVENVATCGDGQLSASVLGFGVAHTAIFMRSTLTGSSRYQLDLISNGHAQIQRVSGGTTTVLADVASGLSDLGVPATLTLTATGTSPVQLVAFVNGRQIASATDSSSAAITGNGYAGLFTLNAGVAFDTFVLSGAGSSSGPAPDAGSVVDAGAAVDAGVARDAGSNIDAGGGTSTGGSGSLTLTVEYTDTNHRIFAVDPNGTAYAADLSGDNTIYASTDGRTWSARGNDSNHYVSQMTALSDGVLLADVILDDGTHAMARSLDSGQTWSDVLSLGNYRALTSHNWGELDGEVFFLEYQDFTNGNATLRLWVSDDRGASWSVRNTFTTHRHGHGMIPDPARHALWIYFGDTDAQSGIYRSTDAGNTFTLMLSGQPGDVVDAIVRADGSLLFGQDISFLPPTPHIATLAINGAYNELAQIIGPSYAIHAIRSGGYVVGSEREPDGDIYPPGEVSAHVYASPDGVSWQQVLDYPRLNSTDNARADVYWELPSGELLLELENIQGFGPQGKGYQLLKVVR